MEVLPANAIVPDKSALAASLLVAGVTYFAAVMALGGVEEADLRQLPKGTLLISIGRKCYLLRDPENVAAARPVKGKRKSRKKREKADSKQKNSAKSDRKGEKNDTGNED